MGQTINLTGVPDFDQLEVVKESTATVSSDGSPLNWATIPHNLGYRPIIITELNDVGITGIFTDADVPIPSWTDVNIVGGNVTFQSFLSSAADATNTYFILLNATGLTRSYSVKYYLLRKRSR